MTEKKSRSKGSGQFEGRNKWWSRLAWENTHCPQHASHQTEKDRLKNFNLISGLLNEQTLSLRCSTSLPGSNVHNTRKTD